MNEEQTEHKLVQHLHCLCHPPHVMVTATVTATGAIMSATDN